MGSAGLILFLILKLTKSVAVPSVLFIVYFIANLVFTFLYYYRKYYASFSFNPNTAWLNAVPSFGIVASVFVFLIAFSNSIHYGKYVDAPKPKDETGASNRGVIVGVAGAFKDANFDIVDDEEIVLGRSAQEANVIFGQLETDVSRKHCSVRFDGRANPYIVTDYSSSGTGYERARRYGGKEMTDRLCLSCMRKYDGQFGICPYCGYAHNTPPEQAYHLTPGVILQGKYIVERVLGFGGFGVTYIG